MTYPDGKTAKYTYDSMNRLVSVKGADGKKATYTYDLNGQRISTDGYREDTAYTYDEVGNLISQVTSGKYDVSLNYTYDLSGRMISESRTENGTAIESSYIYDALGQLTEFTRSDGIAESYNYDPAGNMLSKTAGGVKTNYTYNAANQLVGDGTYKYTYDKIGNLVEKAGNGGQVSYTYNALNLLEKWTDGENTESYTYNAAGLLSTVNTNSSTTTLTWDILYGDGVVISSIKDGQTTDYTYGLERISASTKNSRTEYVYDGRGSVIGEVTKSGFLSPAKVTTKAYAPFGEQIGEATSGFGWNGEYYNAVTGQVYLRARFYEPEMNRFSQKDILRGSIIDGASLNRYLYCTNDPVNFIDPSGQGKVWDWVKGTFKSAVEEVKSWFAPKQPTVDAVTSAAPSVPKPQTSTYTPPTPAPDPTPTPIPPAPSPGPSPYYPPSPAPSKGDIPQVENHGTYTSCTITNDSNGPDNYIIFTTGKGANFTNQAIYQGNILAGNGENVTYIVTNTRQGFEDAWSSIDSANSVMLLVHSNGKSLIFEDGSSSEAISIDGKNRDGDLIGDITSLPAPTVYSLTLYSCNTGNLDLMESNSGKPNIAQAFLSLGSISQVTAYDGNVGFGKDGFVGNIITALTGDYYPRQSNNQEQFVEYSGTERAPEGAVVYNQDGSVDIKGW